VAWDCAAAKVADNVFRASVADFVNDMMMCIDMAFHTHSGSAQPESLPARSLVIIYF